MTMTSDARRLKWAAAVLGVLGMMAAAAPVQAQTAGSATALTLPPALLVLGAGSVCVKITYDANGNRTGQTVTTVSAGGITWGSGTFGCFVWHQ